jgi:hypothetical protein
MNKNHAIMRFYSFSKWTRHVDHQAMLRTAELRAQPGHPHPVQEVYAGDV